MKRFLVIILAVLFISLPVFAQKDDDNKDKDKPSDDVFNSTTFDDPFGGQKMYTDEDFQKALEEKKAQLKKKKKKKVKGDSHSDLEDNKKIDETAEKCIILMLSNNIINGDGTYIPVGHYKIEGVKENGQVFLDFYQAHTKVARVPAIETKYDFDQPEINFAKVLPYDDKKIKVIFGSLDFNAWTLLRVIE